MDGIINLNKPRGITSAKALYRVRKITGIRKSGHAGTLDPAADGVLVLCLGKATKLVESLMDQPKVYRTTARLDVTSVSFDADEPMQPVAIARQPDIDTVRDALVGFEGVIEQVPPALSAIKVGGQPAYKLTRRGKPPDLKARSVTIHWLSLVAYKWPVIEFEMACGRGTYVRSLIRDLGTRLRTGGCLTHLTRRAVGPFHINDAFSPDALEELSDPSVALVPLPVAKTLLATHAKPTPPCV